MYECRASVLVMDRRKGGCECLNFKGYYNTCDKETVKVYIIAAMSYRYDVISIDNIKMRKVEN